MELSLLEDAELRRAFDTPTLARGREYADRGMVRSWSRAEDDEEVLLEGTVEGSHARPYACVVSLGVNDDDGVWADSICSCPVGVSCKHAAALLLLARDRAAARAPADARWERRLSALLDELEDVSGTGAEPLALQFELRRPTWAVRQTTGAAYSPGHGHLRVRPVRRGARGGWVRSGISWRDLSWSRGLGYLPAQATVLAELEAGYRAATRQVYSSDSHLQVSLCGPALWGQLDRATRAGVELVAGDGLAGVELSPVPAELRLDVNSGDGAAHVAVGAWLDGEWYSAQDVDVLGETGHGVALWRDAGRGRGDLTLAPLARAAGPQLRRLLQAGEPLVVPAPLSSDLVTDYLPRVRRHLPVTSSDGSVQLPEPPEPRLVLSVTWEAADTVHLRWTWRYRVGEDDRVYRLDETRGRGGVRRPDREAEVLRALELGADAEHRLFGGRRRDHGLLPEQTLTQMVAVAFAEQVLPELLESAQVEVEEVGARPDYREATGAPVVRFVARDRGSATAPDPGPAGPGSAGRPRLGPAPRQDWLDLEVVVTVDGHSVGLPALLEALTLGHRSLLLPSGLHLRIDRPELARLAELVTEASGLTDRPTDGVRVAAGDLGLWDELAEVGIVDAQAQQWVRAAQALRGVRNLPDVEPVGLAARLRPYQRDGLRWLAFLREAGLGGILADDMGLGKTLQTLALVAHARAAGAGPFLVVAPTSVVATWAQEAAAYAPGLTVRSVTEARSRRGTPLAAHVAGADLVVTSYTLLRLEVVDYAALGWAGLVLDEAQTVKNHQGKTHQAVRRLDVPFRLALTGTPMENRLMELWSLLSVVAPGLYPHPRRFAETVADPVEKGGDLQALARFRRRIRPFLLRRTKELVAGELPCKQEQVLEVTLTPRHRRVYDTHLQRERQAVLGLVGDLDRHRATIFRSLTRLRRLALDAALVDEEYAGIASAKIDVLVDHLTEVLAEGHRALVFSQFTSFLGRVRARLEAEGIASRYLDGRTRRRGEEVAGFKAGDAAVFLISLKAGGVGLNLTEADYVFVLDPWWNPAVEAQAVDRAHRIGQDRPVMVYRLVSAGTIEEKVMALKARKAALFAEVIDGGGGVGSGVIDADDVRELLDGPESPARSRRPSPGRPARRRGGPAAVAGVGRSGGSR